MAEASLGMRRPIRLTGCMQERRGTLAPMSFSTAVGLMVVVSMVVEATEVGFMAAASTVVATEAEATEGGDNG